MMAVEWINSAPRRSLEERGAMFTSAGLLALLHEAKKEYEFTEWESKYASFPLLAVQKRLSSIEKQIGELKDMVQAVLNKVEQQYSTSQDGTIELRDISRDDAKIEIAKYFKCHDGEQIGYDDLIENLKIEPPLDSYAFNLRIYL